MKINDIQLAVKSFDQNTDPQHVETILNDIAKFIPKANTIEIHRIKGCLKKIDTLEIDHKIKNIAKKIDKVADRELQLSNNQKIWPITRALAQNFTIEFFQAKFFFEEEILDADLHLIFSEDLMDLADITLEEKKEALGVLDEIITSQLENRPINFSLVNKNALQIRLFLQMTKTFGIEISKEDKAKLFDIPKDFKDELSAIIEEVISSCKEQRRPNLKAIVRNQHEMLILFHVVEKLGIEDFQAAYLEPLHETFFDRNDSMPKYPLPKNIHTLDLNEFNQVKGNLKEFSSLKKISGQGITWTIQEAEQIPDTIEELAFYGGNVANLDFSKFTNLKILRLNNVQGVTLDSITKIPTTIEGLELQGLKARNIDFTQFPNLKYLCLVDARTEHISENQIDHLPDTIEDLRLFGAIDSNQIDLSRFKNLKRLEITGLQHFTQDQLNMIPENLESLSIKTIDVRDFDFSRFQNLKKIALENILPRQIDTLSAEVEELDIRRGSVDGVDFGKFRNLQQVFFSGIAITNAQYEHLKNVHRHVVVI